MTTVNPSVKNKSYRRLKYKNAFDYTLFLIVPFSLYLVFFIVPNVTSYIYCLFDYDGFGHFKYIGLQNFVTLFNDRVFWIAFKNTVVYALMANIGQNGLAMIFAILLVKQSKINNLFKTVYYLPAILSSVAVGFTWGFILDPTIGILNTALNGMGLSSLALSWLGDPRTVMGSIAFIHIWQAVGGATILFIAGLLDISNDYYEAANIEGASRWQTFTHITFPLLMPVTIINIVLTTIGCFKSFDYVYILTGGGGDNSSHVLSTWLFKQGFQYNAVGYASSIAVVLSLTVSLIALGQLNMQKEDKK